MADQDARRLFDGFNSLPPHPLIHHQGHAPVESHSGPGRDGCYLGDIQMEAVMQREYLATYAWGDKSGLSLHLNGFILPDDEFSDFEVEGFFLPGFHA